MKRIIAAALSILVGAFGYTIVDEVIENRVSTLESKVAYLESIVAENSTTETDDNIMYSGACGETATWNFYADGTLIISGTGDANSFTVPWDGIKSQVIKVTIENGITGIGNSMFYQFSNLSDVTIPDSVGSIGWLAFSGCTSLTTITIPNSVEFIDGTAFKDCYNLSHIDISNSIKSINSELFYYCRNLNNVVIPEGVTRIEGYSFSDCSNLTTITLPASLSQIDVDAFYGTGVTDVFYNGTEEQWNLISIDSGNEVIKNATIHYNSQ